MGTGSRPSRAIAAPLGVAVSIALLTSACGRLWFEELPLELDAGIDGQALDAPADGTTSPDGGGPGDSSSDVVTTGDAPNDSGGPIDSGTADASMVATTSADTYIRGLDVSPHGGDVDLIVGRANSGALMYTLVQFDLSAIPSSAVVLSAKLRLYQFESTSSGTFSIGAHQLLQAWDEATATFTNASSSTAWTTQGGTYDGTAAATTSVPLGAYGWYEWDITAVVQQWVSGSAVNYGVELTMGSVNQGQSVGFASRENTVATERPQLVVTTQ